MTSLITGATGFVGSAVLRILQNAGHHVRALVRANSDRRNLSGCDCEIVIGDLTDPSSLKRAVKGCSAVFHVAADYRLWVPDPQSMKRTNVEGTLALIRAATAAGVSRIVYTSTVGTLRLLGNGRLADEQCRADLRDMIGAYKQSKLQAEQQARRAITEIEAPLVIVQPSAPVGPRDIKPTPTGRLVVEAASGRMPGYVNTGLNIVHVDDVAVGHLLAYEKGAVGESYILGGENRELCWILENIAKITGRRTPQMCIPHWVLLPIAHVSETVARWRRVPEPLITVDGVRLARKPMYFSSDKARQELGYIPRPAIEALRDSIEWFRDQGYIKVAASQRQNRKNTLAS